MSESQTSIINPHDEVERLRSALAAAELGDWDWDAATDITRLSARAAEIMGVAQDVAHRRSDLRTLVDDRDRERTSEALAESRLHGGDYRMEYRFNRPDGTQVWIRARGRGHHDEHGRLTRMSGVLQDITAEKKVASDLQELAATYERQVRLFEQISASTLDFIYVFDTTGRFLYANRRLLEVWGVTYEQAVGKTLDQLGYPDWHVQMHMRELALVIETKKPIKGEVPFTGGSGISGTYEYIFSPVLDDAGNVEVIAGTTRDVTERNRNERAAREARAEAEHASRMKDEFLATLSHELRTPLNAILGWSQLLSADRTSNEELAEGLETIERNARSQKQIIEDLLDMSRIISGNMRLDVQRVDLSAVAQMAAGSLKPAADAKGVRIGLVMDPKPGPINGDPARMQQVLWNLLTNAVKFTPRGGRVQVVLQRVNSHLELSVTDTGEGISPEFLPHVFERFRQSDASTTRMHGGLGLGLAIVKQLVELHGGTIRAKSAGVGCGASFVISLPLPSMNMLPESIAIPCAPAEPGSPVSADHHVDLKGIRVMVLDDEADARALTARLLESCEAIVRTVGSAEEAFTLLQSERPDVFVSDIAMPGEDGYSLIRRIRALPGEAGGNTPAIAMTAYARAEDRVKAVMAGFQHHVAKPVEPAELIAMVASLARSMSALPGWHIDDTDFAENSNI